MQNSAATNPKQHTPLNISSTKLYRVSNIMERDKEQSRRLHEPTSINSHTDPITGNDVMGTAGQPFIVDGILTVYFESEKNRNDYLNTPFNRPVPWLGESSPEDDRGG